MSEFCRPKNSSRNYALIWNWNTLDIAYCTVLVRRNAYKLTDVAFYADSVRVLSKRSLNVVVITNSSVGHSYEDCRYDATSSSAGGRTIIQSLRRCRRTSWQHFLKSATFLRFALSSDWGATKNILVLNLDTQIRLFHHKDHFIRISFSIHCTFCFHRIDCEYVECIEGCLRCGVAILKICFMVLNNFVDFLLEDRATKTYLGIVFQFWVLSSFLGVVSTRGFGIWKSPIDSLN
jgi:hypothetical protein